MRKGLSTFKLVPQRSKHHSVHKKPLSPKNPCHRTPKNHCHSMPKNHCHSMPKKRGHDAYPLSHELQIQNWNSKTWTVCSKFVPSTPILKRELQLSMVSSNYQPWPPIINRKLQCWTLCSSGPTPKFTRTSKLNWTVQNKSRQCPNTLVICYYILLYIICFLFLLYIILYYMYFIFIICYFILYKLP